MFVEKAAATLVHCILDVCFPALQSIAAECSLTLCSPALQRVLQQHSPAVVDVCVFQLWSLCGECQPDAAGVETAAATLTHHADQHTPCADLRHQHVLHWQHHPQRSVSPPAPWWTAYYSDSAGLSVDKAHSLLGLHRERERETQTDRQASRQAGTEETERESSSRQACRQTGWQDRLTEKKFNVIWWQQKMGSVSFLCFQQFLCLCLYSQC